MAFPAEELRLPLQYSAESLVDPVAVQAKLAVLDGRIRTSCEASQQHCSICVYRQ